MNAGSIPRNILAGVGNKVREIQRSANGYNGSGKTLFIFSIVFALAKCVKHL